MPSVVSETDTRPIEDEDLSDIIDSPPPEEIPSETAAAAKKLHGSQCMICGDKDIIYYRIVAQHGAAPGENVLSPSAHCLVDFSSN